MLKLFCAFVFTIFSTLAWADLNIPQQMDRNDRLRALEILGLSTVGKLASNPYPLGGYWGLEISTSFEYLDLENLHELGSGAEEQKNLIYPSFSFGKGLYGDVDLFFYFTPFFESISLSRFGGLLRWSFFQSSTWPISLSATLHAGSSNIDNKVTTEFLSYYLVSSFQLNKFSFYAGLGETKVSGQFIGDSDGANTSGVTDSGETEEEKVEKISSIYGVSYHLEAVSVTFELNHISSPTYTLKVGFRF